MNHKLWIIRGSKILLRTSETTALLCFNKWYVVDFASLRELWILSFSKTLFQWRIIPQVLFRFSNWTNSKIPRSERKRILWAAEMGRNIFLCETLIKNYGIRRTVFITLLSRGRTFYNELKCVKSIHGPRTGKYWCTAFNRFRLNSFRTVPHFS